MLFGQCLAYKILIIKNCNLTITWIINIPHAVLLVYDLTHGCDPKCRLRAKVHRVNKISKRWTNKARGVFRTLLNIQDGTFCENSNGKPLFILVKKLQVFHWILNTPLKAIEKNYFLHEYKFWIYLKYRVTPITLSSWGTVLQNLVTRGEEVEGLESLHRELPRKESLQGPLTFGSKIEKKRSD